MNFYSKTDLFRWFIYNECNIWRNFKVAFSKDVANKEIASQMKVPDDYDVSKVTKEDLKWREYPHEENKQYFKSLRVFYQDTNNVEVVKSLQTPFDYSFEGIRKWWKKINIAKKKFEQSYLQDRNKILGNELAAAHFIVYRGGAIKFHGDDVWIKADENKNYNLPEYYVRNKYIEAIDCTNTDIYYEALQNFQELKFLKWLSLNDCENLDDWCIDTICGAHYKSLVYLDLRNCPNITERGLVALWKMEKLKILYLDDILRSTQYEMTVLLLQEYLPQLEIKVGDFAEDD
ncbi:distal membrane-arm assembly complex protein 2 [Harmonia axyridis]|uniref:distal membrane-arm assembly complex protein 2 n=1 Tax=Harmonia axyridis TaxID=115357 RepID=UPI001E2761B7|nr:distal membrane-arm assembly complex protein 2 [Harmonia axyridis]